MSRRAVTPRNRGRRPRPGADRDRDREPESAKTATVLTVGGPATARPIPPGFLGLSIEYFAIPAYAGTDASAINPVFVQLIRNLSPGQTPQLRIGGDTTDRTWWPLPRTPTPAGVNETLTPGWTATTKALATATGAKLTLGINLEADSDKIARTEADQLVAGLGSNRIEALELGNEPELYGKFTWGRSGKPGRPHDYDFAAFSRDFTRIARALPPLALAGPATGAPRWFKNIGRFLADHARVAVDDASPLPAAALLRPERPAELPDDLKSALSAVVPRARRQRRRRGQSLPRPARTGTDR